jgi:hypothetical protein
MRSSARTTLSTWPISPEPWRIGLAVAATAADDLFEGLSDEQIRKLARTCLVAKLEAAMHSAIRK